MEILVWAFIGGIAGALIMDITETYAAKAGITSGVNIALVGRWFCICYVANYLIQISFIPILSRMRSKHAGRSIS